MYSRINRSHCHHMLQHDPPATAVATAYDDADMFAGGAGDAGAGAATAGD